jgi:hypothetical protein
MIKKNRLAALIFLFAGEMAHSQVTVQTLKPFKSLCISDQETGFDWKDGKWISKKFIPEKYILSKLDYEKAIASEKFIDRPMACGLPKVTKIDEKTSYVSACYAIYTFGSSPIIAVDAQDCIESFTNGNIDFVQCSNVGRFNPNGLFVKLPPSTSMDLSNKTSKDSISLAVGTCGVL